MPEYPPMNLQQVTVLITGGSTGIGLGLAEQFLDAGSTVIVTGRREGALKDAKAKFPALHYFVNDASKPSERIKLAEWAAEKFPNLNVLVNNAGIQRITPLAEDNADWSEKQQEIAINLEAPVHLASLLTPHFLKQPEAAIVNITSGLAFVPFATGPMYSATKAAVHSYTVAMRPHYAQTKIRIVEIAPPPVKTSFATSKGYGCDAGEFCRHVFPRFTQGEQEIGYKLSEEVRQAPREEIDRRFEGMTKTSFKGPTYSAS